MVRNAGKFGKPKRGGKKQFTQGLEHSDRAGMWDGEAKDSEEETSEEESDESEEESSDQEELNSKLATTGLGSSSVLPQEPAQQSRAERKAAKKQKKQGGKTGTKDGDEDQSSQDELDVVNSNRVAKKSVKLEEISKLETGPLNRKEREAAEKKAAQERYWKLHQAGKTDEAKTDLARLARIRQEREQAAALRKAEAEAKAKEAADKLALRKKK